MTASRGVWVTASRGVWVTASRGVWVTASKGLWAAAATAAAAGDSVEQCHARKRLFTGGHGVRWHQQPGNGGGTGLSHTCLPDRAALPCSICTFFTICRSSGFRV